MVTAEQSTNFKQRSILYAIVVRLQSIENWIIVSFFFSTEANTATTTTVEACTFVSPDRGAGQSSACHTLSASASASIRLIWWQSGRRLLIIGVVIAKYTPDFVVSEISDAPFQFRFLMELFCFLGVRK